MYAQADPVADADVAVEAQLADRVACYPPLLAVACNSAQALGRLARRVGDVVVLEHRQAKREAYRALGLSVYREVPSGERQAQFAAVVVGADLLTYADEQRWASLRLWLEMLEDGGEMLLPVVDDGCAADDLVRRLRSGANVRPSLLSPAVDGVRMLSLRKVVDRPCWVDLQGSRDAEYDSSLAHVNAEILRAYAPSSSALKIVQLSPPGFAAVPDIVIRHSWPPDFSRPQCRYYIQLQPWEFGALPQAWCDELDRVDEVWCYTEAVAQQYRAAGFAAERIRIMPLGFDPSVYHSHASSEEIATRDEQCVFSFVGGMVERKGIDVVVRAYAETFTAADRVCLVVKANRFYSAAGVERYFEPLQRAGAPRYALLQERYEPAELASLYRASTALLAPSRGEGFGLPALEAMACGTPVVFSSGGSMDDFLDETCGYPVRTTRKILERQHAPMAPLHQDGFLLEPDFQDLQTAMRTMYEHREDARARGRAAAARAHTALTWAHTAKRVEERCMEIRAALGFAQ